jgi:hypothetical protein
MKMKKQLILLFIPLAAKLFSQEIAQDSVAIKVDLYRRSALQTLPTMLW